MRVTTIPDSSVILMSLLLLVLIALIVSMHFQAVKTSVEAKGFK